MGRLAGAPLCVLPGARRAGLPRQSPVRRRARRRLRRRLDV